MPKSSSEVVGLLAELRERTFELAELRRKAAADQQLHRTERTIDQLRRRLATAARRAATDELGNTA